MDSHLSRNPGVNFRDESAIKDSLPFLCLNDLTQRGFRVFLGQKDNHPPLHMQGPAPVPYPLRNL